MARDRVNDSIVKLTSGKEINQASDGPSYIPGLTRLRSHSIGLTAIVKNINAAMTDLEMADSALAEIQNLLSRMKEISTQAANAATTSSTRLTLTEELGQLRQEIDHLAANSRSSGVRLLEGSYSGKVYQVGAHPNDRFAVNITSSKPTDLGSYISDGPTRAALAAAQTASTNTTTDSEDIVLTHSGQTTTINVADSDSAKTVAGKVNALAGQTRIQASAQTYAHLFSTNASSANYTIAINGSNTSTFAISNSDVTDAVSKINLISGSTGVVAKATADGKVLLHDSDGDDITIENANSGVDLDVQAVEADGSSTSGGPISLQAGAGSDNDATRVIGSLRLSSESPFSITQSGNSALGYATTNTPSLSDLNSVDLSTAVTSSQSFAILDSAIEQVSEIRGTVAASQSRLNFRESANLSRGDNLLGAISDLEDVDFAVESARLAKALILQETSSVLLSQANASQQFVLNLLKSAA